MTARLTLICHAPTDATRAARFPAPGDAVEPRSDPLPAPGGEARCLSAPERRARDLAAALGFAPEIDGGLRDQDFGRWAGRTLAEVATAEPDGLAAWVADPAAAPHGGESVAALLARVESWMAARAAEGGRALAVTHPAVARSAVATALGAGATGFWRVEAAPLTRVRLSHDGRRWALAGLVPP